MGYAKHVGRVGALAVALGVGTAIAGSAGTAWAEPAEKAATSAATDSDPAPTADTPVADAVTAEPTPQPETAGPTADPTAPPTSVPAEETTQSRVEVVPGVVVAHSGGAQDSTYGSASNNDAPHKNSNKPNTVKAAPASTTASPPAPAESITERAVAPKAVEVSAPAVVSTAVAEVVTSPPGLAAEPRTAVVSTAVHPVWNALAAIFGSGPGPKTPSQTPLSWVLVAAARREVGDVAFARTTALAGAANQPPADPVVTVNNPNASTGVVTGTAVSTDPDGDTVTYRVPATTTKGAVTITAAGAFTYTPTAAARHAAAAITAPASAKQDTFTVTVSDGYGGTTTAPVTVNILGRNTAPGGWANVGWPNTTTGVTTGTISASDADYDALRYSAANTTKGTVTITTTGAWTYTPTTAARHAAAAIGAPASAKQDTITLTVSDGYGGTTSIPVTLTIIPKNTAPTNPIATVGNPHPATGVVTGTVRATDADGDTLSYTTPATTSKGAVTITGTGDFTYTPTAAARRAAAAVNAPASAKTDTFTVTITDGHGGSTTKAVTVTVAPRVNQPPTTPVVTVNNPNASTGVVTGTAVSTDPDGDTVTYRVPATTTKGAVTITAAGAFTYTPTAAARHAAAAITAPASAKQDTFTVTVSDGYGGTTTAPVTVNILGRNTAPGGWANVGWPNTTTGVTTGTISASDADYDALRYSAANTTKGTVTITTTGAWTYTPTTAARHAAAAIGAPASAKQDTITLTVSDGYGGTTNIPVTLTIIPKNTAPTNAVAIVSNTHLRTGVVTGAITASDADGDGFTYKSTTSTKGALSIGTSGAFTYTPTAAARQAASAASATPAAKQDTFTITLADGHGGPAQTVLTVAVTPYGANSPLTQVSSFVGQPNSAIGAVQGTVTAIDPEGDALTYRVTSGPTKGSVSIDTGTGAFTYTPTTRARYDATVRPPGQVVDSFTVTVSDAYGASVSTTVSAVPIAGYDAHAIDQRPTSVGITDPYLYYASQEETDEILDRLRAAGVDTVRIHVPWAGVEVEDDVYDWSRVDRMVDSARARNITVVATLNHTPEWAVTPGQPPLSGAPADPQTYADFAGVVAARYAGRVSAYEVWNEPNAKIFWGPEPSPAQYTALLKVAYAEIKAADPNATVVAGSVGFIEDNPGETIDAVRFVREMYENGAAGSFDALAFHPYHYWSPLSVEDPEQIYPRAQLEQIHQLMVANGDGEKVIWATEYGQPTLIGGEARQAEFLADFLRTWREIPYAGPAYLYTTRDGVGYTDLENSFGLYREDWTPKPALGVVEEVIDENDARDL